MDERFAAWSRTVLAGMTGGEVSAVDVPPYVVQYAGAHLERMNAAPDQLTALLRPEWREAWEAMEGGLAGFATDVARAWHAARRENERLIAAGASPRHLATEVLCFLLQTRIRSLAKALPPVVMGRLVEERLWNPRQAAAYARNVNDSVQRVAALAEAARRAEARERGVLLAEARANAGRLEEPRTQAEAQVHLLRAGEPLDPFLELQARDATSISDFFVAAGEALIESGRASEIARLGSPAYHIYAVELLHRMIDRNALDEAEAVFRQHRSTYLYRTGALVWRFAVRGRDVFEPAGNPSVPRIHELYERSLQALPLPLVAEDVTWVADLCWNKELFDDLDKFATAICAAVEGDLRNALDAAVTDSVTRARLKLADPEDTRQFLWERFQATDRSEYNESRWLREVAVLGGKNVIERAVMLAAKTAYFTPRERHELVQVFLRLDPEALRSAVMQLPSTTSSLWRGEVLATVAALDPAFRETHLRQLMTLRREDTAWPQAYDQLAPVLDRTSLLTLTELFARIGDVTWSESVLFIFDPREEELPRLAGVWQQSTQAAGEGVLVAAAAPELAEAVLRQIVRNPPEGIYWPEMIDLMAQLLPAAPAAKLRDEIWRRMAEEPDRFIGAIAAMSSLPSGNFLVEWKARLSPRLPSSDAEGADQELGRILLLPASARGVALSAFEQRPDDELDHAELRHVAAELSQETIARLVAYATKDQHTLGRSAIMALAPRMTEADRRALSEHAMTLDLGTRSWIVPFLLPALPEPERSRVLAWIASPEVIAQVAGHLVEVGLRWPAIRPTIIETLRHLDLVATIKMISRTSREVSIVIICASRVFDLDAATARRLALVAIDPGRDKVEREESWATVAGLRPLLLRSNDEALFPEIHAAIERAVSIFP